MRTDRAISRGRYKDDLTKGNLFQVIPIKADTDERIVIGTKHYKYAGGIIKSNGPSKMIWRKLPV